MTNLRDCLKTKMKESMIAKDSETLGVVRMISAKIKDADISARSSGSGDIDDTAILSLLQNMIKQRNDSATMYADAGRTELADKEVKEIAIITQFLPVQMSESEIAIVVKDAIAHVGANSMADMGKVMGHIKSEHAGKLDMAIASKLIKNTL